MCKATARRVSQSGEDITKEWVIIGLPAHRIRVQEVKEIGQPQDYRNEMCPKASNIVVWDQGILDTLRKRTFWFSVSFGEEGLPKIGRRFFSAVQDHPTFLARCGNVCGSLSNREIP